MSLIVLLLKCFTQSGQRKFIIKIPKQAPVILNTAVPKRSNKKRDFLFNLSTKELKYGRKINQLLNRYRTRKLKLQKRKKEWDAFKTIKPVKVNTTEDESALTSAIKAIGDYKLKSSANYKVPESSQITSIKIFRQILVSRLKQYNMIHDYNKKVYEIRTKRVQVIKRLQTLNIELQNFHEELSDENKKFAPNIQLIEDDFAEKNLNVVIIVSDKNSPIIETEIVQIPNKDLLEKEVLIENTDVEEDSEWEIEARNQRKNRKIFQQDLILNKIKKDVNSFDNEISTLAKQGNEVKRDVDLLDLHMITLNQELIIVKEFETAEKEIIEKICNKIDKLHQIQSEIESNRLLIKNNLEKVQSLRKDENILKKRFLTAIEGNAHYRYLKRVFKGHENEMFSSSESSMDSEISENLDECDQGLYEIALDFQKQRLAIHEGMKELKNKVDCLNDEIKSTYYVRSKKIERYIKSLRDGFDKLQTEKQSKLNQVMCTVVLKLHQLQHLDAYNAPTKVGDTLIFSQSILSSLYKKVGHLHNETELQKTKHKTYFAHLCRMKTDCHLMKEQIKELQNQIEESIKKKIGVVVKVDVIEEERLKQKLFEFKLSQTNVKSLFEQQLRKWSETLKAKQIELKEIIKENTSKMNVLTALNKEKTELIQILDKQSLKKQHLDRVVVVAEMCKENIEKLSEIIKNQNQEIEILQNEIKRLSYKTVPSTSAKMSDEMFSLHLDTDSARRNSFRFKLWDHKDKEVVADKQESPISQPLHTTEVQIPSVLSDEIEEMVQHAVLEMLESLGNISKISKIETEHIVQQIIPNIMAQNNVDDIINDLKNFLPKDFTAEQHDTVEDAAKRIILLLHPQLKFKNIEDSARELLIEVVEEIVHDNEELQLIMEKLLMRLVQCLPIKYLIQEDTINVLIRKIEDLLEESEESILNALSTISIESTADVQEFIKQIIEVITRN